MTAATIEIPSRFERSSVAAVHARLAEVVRRGAGRVHLDLSAVEHFDSAGMACIVEALQTAQREGVDLHLVGVKEPVLDFFSLMSVERLLAPQRRIRHAGYIERVGAAVTPAISTTAAGVRLLSQTIGGLVLAPARRERTRLSRALAELDETGRRAVPIVTLIAFLLGLILAMQAWVQLRVFAAEIFVADMLAVSVTREIGPLMTAILIAARSGSAIAAQLGTMVINEEVDALRQMGINPLGYLVAPKVVALSVAAPCLSIVFCAVAIGGGLLFSLVLIGIDWNAYLEQTRQALKMTDLLAGLLKSTVFGGLVAAVGCTLGMGVSGGPEGVARATTRAVVASIFLIIVVDAFFVVVLRMTG